jgi:hypothetical protein
VAAGLEAGESGPPTGALVIRVWQEGVPGAWRLRARLTGRMRVNRDESRSMASSDVDDIVAKTRAWLEEFISGY